MTTFEILVTIFLAVVVLLLGFIAFCVWNHYRDVELSNYMLRKKLDNIDTNTATSVSVGIDIKDKIGKTSPNVPIYTPCYTPDGICMNPHMDCINCPKRGTGGTWITSTNLNKAK